ncbi:hypothetical protein QN357_05905 [Cryobacterium sp. RTC2.1]|uniref:hypothetical protein n=3 Tax=Bacteria TaxID=2 RepID=UPI002B22ED87|nr:MULTISPECIES: hypothetical protein [unclassified Cryobacterium]MEB0002470.1 hypothetical protein [Cryobacterium sp. RTC2.1]MEB0203663.1 hypothetical protein [Cryobacterium sp. 5I3]
MTTINLNKGAWLAHHAAVYARHAEAFPAGSVISVCARSAGSSVFRTAGFAAPGDAEAAWKLIEREAAQGGDTWVSVGVIDGSVAAAGGRGKKADVLGMVALVVDVDTDDGEHRVSNNPSRAEVTEWLTEIPAPTVSVDSSGGFHWWFALDTPVDPRTVEGAELIARHRAFWLAFGARRGRNIDAGPLHTLSQVLRPAGTVNAKGAELKPVTLVTAGGPVYSHQDLLSIYPPLPVKAPVAVCNRAFARSATLSSPRDPNAAPRLGDLFAVGFPVDSFLQEVFGADLRGNGVSMPDRAGDTADRDSGRFFETADVQRVTFFSSTAQAGFGLEDDAHSHSSFDVLAHTVGGYKEASALLRPFAGEWFNADLVDAVIAAMLPRVADAFGVVKPVTSDAPVPAPAHASDESIPYSDVPPPDSDFDFEGPVVVVQEAAPRVVYPATAAGDQSAVDALLATREPSMQGTRSAAIVATDESEVRTTPTPPRTVEKVKLTVARAIETRTPSTFKLSNHVEVRLWDAGHGVYEMVKTVDDEGIETWKARQICDWVPWRSMVVSRASLKNGFPVENGEKMVTVTIARSDEVVRSAPGFTPEDATNPAAVVQRLDMGVALPIGSTKKEHLANVLRELGSDDASTRIQELTTMGWLVGEPGVRTGVTYAAPGGSVNGCGRVQDISVGVPAKSDVDSLTPTHFAHGWRAIATTSEELREGAQALAEFIKLSPNVEAPVALAGFGMMASAPLSLSRRATLMVASPPDMGKTLLLSAMQSFLTPAWRAGWTGGTLISSSASGCGVLSSYLASATGFWDDYRVPEIPADAARVKGALARVLQASYTAVSGEAKGTQNGGLRGSSDASTTSIVSGEALSEEQGIASRVVSISLEAGRADIAMLPMGTSPIDEWRKKRPDAANRLFGAYISYLARQIDKLPRGLSDWTTANDELKATLMPKTGGRSAETAVVIATGWSRFLDFAAEAGIEDLLPTMADVNVVVSRLAETSGERARNTNPASTLVRAVRDAIAGGSVYLELANGGVPVLEQARSLGWTIRPDRIGTLETVPSRMAAGLISMDGKYVLLYGAALKDLKRFTAVAAVPMGQVDGGFASVVVAGTEPGGKSPVPLGLNRKRGYVVAADLLDLPGTPLMAMQGPADQQNY